MTDRFPEDHKISVGWIPAHPVYGAVSMRRYWQALNENVRESDPFRVESIIHPTDVAVPTGILGSASRFWQRRISYPSLIRKKFNSQIAHVLDHSWADMLKYLPVGALKIVTLHDLIPLRFPGELTAAQASRFQSWVSNIGSADAVIADSLYTKNEAIELLKIPAEKISVVSCGVELPTPVTGLNRVNLQAAPGTLTVGSIGSAITRKNLDIFPKAFSHLVALNGPKKVRLVRVGSLLPPQLAMDIRNVLGENGLVELGHLTDEELGSFYQAMDVVVIPSLYEGFGLPVLEAMARGVPVISSNSTSLPEVGGDVAIYFDPASPEQLAMCLATFGQKEDLGIRRERGVVRAARFTWRASLEGVFSVYRNALESRSGSRRSNG